MAAVILPCVPSIAAALMQLAGRSAFEREELIMHIRYLALVAFVGLSAITSITALADVGDDNSQSKILPGW